MSVVASFEIYTALSKPLLKDVFRLILRSRFLSRYELEMKEDVPSEELQSALDELSLAGLIGVTPADISDFDKFYPTGSGLAAEKLVS